MNDLNPPGEVFGRHPVERRRAIPSVKLVSRVCGERMRPIRASVARRQENEITTRIVDEPASERPTYMVVRHPKPMVDHSTEEVLLRSTIATEAPNAAATFEAEVAGDGESPSVDEAGQMIECPNLDAVVSVKSDTIRMVLRVGPVVVVRE